MAATILPGATPDAPRVCPRAEMVARGWRPLANDCTPDEMEYSKEYAAPQGGVYHLFARDAHGELRLSLAYHLRTGAAGLVSAALRPDEVPAGIRAQAEADIAAARGPSACGIEAAPAAAS